MMKKSNLLLSVLLLLPLTSHAAINLTDNFSVSGFGSFSAATSDNENPIVINRGVEDDWCFDCDSTLGLQADLVIIDNLRASIQVVKRPQDSYSSPEVEWVYLSYNYDNFTFRGGRLRLPLFIKSEYYYVSYAFPEFRPQQDIYDSLLGITAYDGLSLTWEGMVQDAVGVQLTPYWSMPSKDTYHSQGYDIEVDSDFILGANLKLSYEDTLFNFSALFSNYTGTSTYPGSSIFPGFSADFENDMKLYSIGIEQYFDDLLVIAEGVYSKDFYANWYISLYYPIANFTPYISYGQQRLDASGRQGLIGVRYDINRYIAINLEAQYLSAKEVALPTRASYFDDLVSDADFDAALLTLGVSFAF